MQNMFKLIPFGMHETSDEPHCSMRLTPLDLL